MYEALTVINFVLLIYILFRMKDYNQLVADNRRQNFLKAEKHKLESWNEIVKFFGSEAGVEKHYQREFLDDLDRSYKYHIEHGTEPIEGFEQWMKDQYAKLDSPN